MPLALDNLDKLIFIIKNCPNDFRVGCSSFLEKKSCYTFVIWNARMSNINVEKYSPILKSGIRIYFIFISHDIASEKKYKNYT
jgi:hypothetical protein